MHIDFHCNIRRAHHNFLVATDASANLVSDNMSTVYAHAGIPYRASTSRFANAFLKTPHKAHHPLGPILSQCCTAPRQGQHRPTAEPCSCLTSYTWAAAKSPTHRFLAGIVTSHFRLHVTQAHTHSLFLSLWTSAWSRRDAVSAVLCKQMSSSLPQTAPWLKWSQRLAWQQHSAPSTRHWKGFSTAWWVSPGNTPGPPRGTACKLWLSARCQARSGHHEASRPKPKLWYWLLKLVQSKRPSCCFLCVLDSHT